MTQIRFTKDGYEKLKQEYQKLKFERPAAVEHLRKARELGDLSENGYYKASRAKLSFIDSRLRMYVLQLREGVVVDGDNSGLVDIGRVVTLFDGKTQKIFQIVGDLEADPSQGKLSLLSPLGIAIAKRHAGSEVKIETPGGEVFYTIVSVD
jgi:transcription elongation factor GreA